MIEITFLLCIFLVLILESLFPKKVISLLAICVTYSMFLYVVGADLFSPIHFKLESISKPLFITVMLGYVGARYLSVTQYRLSVGALLLPFLMYLPEVWMHAAVLIIYVNIRKTSKVLKLETLFILLIVNSLNYKLLIPANILYILNSGIIFSFLYNFLSSKNTNASDEQDMFMVVIALMYLLGTEPYQIMELSGISNMVIMFILFIIVSLRGMKKYSVISIGLMSFLSTESMAIFISILSISLVLVLKQESCAYEIKSKIKEDNQLYRTLMFGLTSYLLFSIVVSHYNNLVGVCIGALFTALMLRVVIKEEVNNIYFNYRKLISLLLIVFSVVVVSV
jgi:hypothetical protein